MLRCVLAASLAAALAGCAPLRPVRLAADGKATVAIVVGLSPTRAEQTAAEELAAYLGKITGGSFAIAPETTAPKTNACIYVGHTAFAGQHLADATTLGPEEWVIRRVGSHLVLTGGRPRGTLYAVYRFLEDEVGVRWWNPFEESVPHKPTLTLGRLSRRGRPVLRYRDIYMLYGRDGGRFAARNRLNRDGDARIAPHYGGCMDYGPPYHVHTFYMYFPPKAHFATHPEWYSLIAGKRSTKRAQLCLTNAEMRRAFVAKLKSYIAQARAAASKEGRPAPRVYSVSQNDWGGMCECPACQAVAKAEGSEAGPLLDFVNYVADAVKDDYPDVFIDTLAYQMTQKAPKSIKARDNVIVRLCDTTSNFTKPITHPQNRKFREHILSWATVAKNLRIWDYAVTYAPYYGIPLPTVHTYPADYRFYAEHNVEGVFTEHEYPILADLRDLKIWMMIKLLEDPYRDYDALLAEFTDGFYGPAGKHIRAYLHALEAASEAKSSYLSMGASPRQYRYLDLRFVREAMAVFDRAEQAVAGDPTLLRRVRFARLPLDRAALVLFPQLMKQWLQGGREPGTMPLDRKAIGARCKQAWHAEADLRLASPRREAAKMRADAEVGHLLARKAYVPVPEKFRHLPPASVFHYTADETRNWQDIVKRIPDPEAESGITNRLELDAETRQKPGEQPYKLPMPCGLYNVMSKKGAGGGVIKPQDVAGPGYHWYRLGTFEVGPSYYLYFFWSWIIQVDIDNVVDPDNREQKFDVWARIKFEGPGFPHGKPGDTNAICVERVVLVKTGGK